MSRLHRHLASLTAAPDNGYLNGIRRGVEKESLRVVPKGKAKRKVNGQAHGALATTPHGEQLGSALTHPHITTDFSEALLEFITEPFRQPEDALQQLHDVHAFTYRAIGDELLWVNSMPCFIADDDIPVARYGSSNAARMKTIYRLGLGHRYGRLMQTIAGIHYNFSLPDDFWRLLQELEKNSQPLQDYKTQRYFDLIRNFRRYFWLLLYLFGAAPAVCTSFVKGRKHSLTPFNGDKYTLHAPYATSLRMGDLGYQSAAQKTILANYNNLPDYLAELCAAITRPHPDYVNIGVKNSAGEYRQLNTGILQIENEFYSTVRPKRPAHSGETALGALHQRGVDYIEVRCLDLNPYEPLGINTEQMAFIDSFLLYCLLEDSPLADPDDALQVAQNQQTMVYRGRDPKLVLNNHKRERRFNQWARELLEEIGPVAQLLDSARNTREHSLALEQQAAKVSQPELTPSAMLLSDLASRGESFTDFTYHQSETHARYFREQAIDPTLEQQFRQLAIDSLEQQRAIESGEQLDFETYLKNFYQQYQNCGDCGGKTAQKAGG